MTSQSPRIYLYKITFIDTSYYYYGVHKEKRFNEYYMGSPKTHKWCWELYEPEKQILEFFEFSDEGYTKAQEIEKQLIKPFFNTDKWCLNGNCGGRISLKVARKYGLKHKENGTGIFSLTPEERKQNGIKGGLKNKENGTGIFSQTPDQRSEHSRKIGLKSKELGIGIFSSTPEERKQNGKMGGKIGGNISKENKLGFFKITIEERYEIAKKSGLKTKELKVGIHAQTNEEKIKIGNYCRDNKLGIHSPEYKTKRWKCKITGKISTANGLTIYQTNRNIDTNQRELI